MAPAAQCFTTYAFDRFTVDRDDERLLGPFGPIRLGNKAFQVLVTLIEYRNRLVTKDLLMSTVWDGTTVSESALTSVIKELRRALGDDARSPRFIESVYGRGYRLLSHVVEDSRDESFDFRTYLPPHGPRPDAHPATEALRDRSDMRPQASAPAEVGQCDDRPASRASISLAPRFALILMSILALVPATSGSIADSSAVAHSIEGR